METNSSEDQGGGMEVDGETSAMDTNDDGGEALNLTDTKPTDISHFSTEPGSSSTLPVAVTQSGGMVGEESAPETRSQVWRMPEGVCHKRVLRKGEGSYGPSYGARCSVSLETLRGTLGLDPARVGFPLGQSGVEVGEGGTPVSALIDAALTSMKKGETAEVRVSGVPPALEGEYAFCLTLHDFTSVAPSWRLSPVEKCASAAARKERGAQLFKQGDVYGAFAKFRAAIRLLLSILPHTFDGDENAGKSHQNLLYQCYLNLAACQMKTGHHRHVVANCSLALNLDPSSVKALYRRASANVSLGNYLRAQEDLEVGLKVEPHNRALLDLMHSVSSKLAHSQTLMAQGLSKMFS